VTTLLATLAAAPLVHTQAFALLGRSIPRWRST
jgi:hypothetical protein